MPPAELIWSIASSAPSWVVLSEFADSPATCQNKAKETGWSSLPELPCDELALLAELEAELPHAASVTRAARTAMYLTGFLATGRIIERHLTSRSPSIRDTDTAHAWIAQMGDCVI